MGGSLLASREAILGRRRAVQALDQRLPSGAASLRRAAWAGLQDSMPRAALLSIHARVAGARPDVLADPSLVQVWGPRFSVFVIAERDLAPFTIGRHPADPRGRVRADNMATAVAEVLGDRELTDREVAATLGVGKAIRYATTTGTMLIRWEGAQAPTVRVIAAPPARPAAARNELIRRYLHVYGPTDAPAFAQWAGVSAREAAIGFAELTAELIPVRTPIGDRLLLASDEPALRSAPAEPAAARLLPSGDPFYLLHGADRELVVPSPSHRAQLWTSRVWPGAVLVAGQIVGTWRRANTTMGIQPWRLLAADELAAIEAEAASLPLPALPGPISVRWSD